MGKLPPPPIFTPHRPRLPAAHPPPVVVKAHSVALAPLEPPRHSRLRLRSPFCLHPSPRRTTAARLLAVRLAAFGPLAAAGTAQRLPLSHIPPPLLHLPKRQRRLLDHRPAGVLPQHRIHKLHQQLAPVLLPPLNRRPEVVEYQHPVYNSSRVVRRPQLRQHVRQVGHRFLDVQHRLRSLPVLRRLLAVAAAQALLCPVP